NTSLGALGIVQSFVRIILGNEQFDHRVVRIDFGCKEALLFLLAARDLSALGFDGGNGRVKGLASAAGLTQSNIGFALGRDRLLEESRVAEALGKVNGSLGKLQSLCGVALRLVNLPDVVQCVGNAFSVADLLSDPEALLKMLQRLRVVALRLVNTPDVV